jgi:hypothetical protein
MLAAYASQACPSAMLNILADALALAADRADYDHAREDAAWLRHVASEMRSDVLALRADEDALYCGPDAAKEA